MYFSLSPLFLSECLSGLKFLHELGNSVLQLVHGIVQLEGIKGFGESFQDHIYFGLPINLRSKNLHLVEIANDQHHMISNGSSSLHTTVHELSDRLLPSLTSLPSKHLMEIVEHIGGSFIITMLLLQHIVHRCQNIASRNLIGSKPGRQDVFLLLRRIIIRLRTGGGENPFVLVDSKDYVEVTFPVDVIVAFEFIRGKNC